MYYTYNLKSLKDGTYYKGVTNDLEKRLRYHNSGKVPSTRLKRPWIIHYFETFETKKEAIRREHFFKTFQGFLWLKENKILSGGGLVPGRDPFGYHAVITSGPGRGSHPEKKLLGAIPWGFSRDGIPDGRVPRPPQINKSKD
jgi:putative endonuclease